MFLAPCCDLESYGHSTGSKIKMLIPAGDDSTKETPKDSGPPTDEMEFSCGRRGIISH